MGSPRSKTWHIETPDMEDIEIHDLKAWCKTMNLSYPAMLKVLKDPDKLLEHDGYRAGEKQEAPGDAHESNANDAVALINDGLQSVTEASIDRKLLAEQSGISAQSVWRLMTGKAAQVRGWRILTPGDLENDVDHESETEIDIAGEDEL